MIGAREALLPHVLAAAVAVVMSEALLLALTRFGSGPGIITAVALPVLLAALVIPEKKRILLWLTVLALPILLFSPPPRRLGLTLGDILIAGLAVLTVLEKLLAEERSWHWEKTVFTWPLLGLLLATLLSALLSDDSQLAFSGITENLRYVLFYLLFVSLVRTKADVKLVCLLLVIGYIPSVLLGLAQFFLGVGVEVFGDIQPNTTFTEAGLAVVRVFGPFLDSLAFAQYMIVPLSLLAALLLYSRGVATIAVLAGLLGLGCIALVGTLGRGSWVALFLVVLLFVSLRAPKPLLAYLAVWLAIAALVVVGYWSVFQSVVPTTVAARLSDLGEDYYIGRGYLWAAALRIFVDHPLFGVGLRNLYHALPLYAPDNLSAPVWAANIGETSPVAGLTGYTYYIHVDSVYMTLLPEIGILGMIPLALLLFRAIAQAAVNFRRAPPDLKPYSLGIFGAVFALIFSMATTYAYTDIRIAVLFWLLLAMTVVLQRLAAPNANS